MKPTQINWTNEEDVILLNSINFEGRKNWKYIATLLKNKSAIQCFYRFRKINPIITKSKWSSSDDNLLIHLHEMYGNNWSKISKVMKTRGPKQLRDRFMNNLDPKIKRGNFSIDEDLKILNLKNVYGNKWSLIAKHFQNRSPDIIKSRYYSSIKNKKQILFFLDSLDDNKNKKNYDILRTDAGECHNDNQFTIENINFENLRNVNLNIIDINKYSSNNLNSNEEINYHPNGYTKSGFIEIFKNFNNLTNIDENTNISQARTYFLTNSEETSEINCNTVYFTKFSGIEDSEDNVNFN